MVVELIWTKQWNLNGPGRSGPSTAFPGDTNSVLFRKLPPVIQSLPSGAGMTTLSKKKDAFLLDFNGIVMDLYLAGFDLEANVVPVSVIPVGNTE